MQRSNHVYSFILEFQLNQAVSSHLLKELWLGVSWSGMLFFLFCVYCKAKDIFLCLTILHLPKSVMKSEAMRTDRSCPSQSHGACSLHVLERSGSISELFSCVACHPDTWDGYRPHNQSQKSPNWAMSPGVQQQSPSMAHSCTQQLYP